MSPVPPSEGIRGTGSYRDGGNFALPRSLKLVFKLKGNALIRRILGIAKIERQVFIGGSFRGIRGRNPQRLSGLYLERKNVPIRTKCSASILRKLASISSICPMSAPRLLPSSRQRKRGTPMRIYSGTYP